MANEWTENGVIMGVIGAIGAVGSVYLTIQKILKNHKEEKAVAAAHILQEAKEEIETLRAQIEAKFALVDSRIANVQEATEKEFEFVKNKHESDIENLGEKIELLRGDLRAQHDQIINLFAKLLDK